MLGIPSGVCLTTIRRPGATLARTATMAEIPPTSIAVSAWPMTGRRFWRRAARQSRPSTKATRVPSWVLGGGFFVGEVFGFDGVDLAEGWEAGDDPFAFGGVAVLDPAGHVPTVAGLGSVDGDLPRRPTLSTARA